MIDAMTLSSLYLFWNKKKTVFPKLSLNKRILAFEKMSYKEPG